MFNKQFYLRLPIIYLLLNILLFLTGLIFIYSASAFYCYIHSSASQWFYLAKQILGIVIGIVTGFLFFCIPPLKLK
jgi:cell division protein FtsW (lipid II flippase)